MAALVSYGSSDEEDNLQEEAPKLNVCVVLRTFQEQADSTDLRSKNVPLHKLLLRTVSSLVGEHCLLYSTILTSFQTLMKMEMRDLDLWPKLLHH